MSAGGDAIADFIGYGEACHSRVRFLGREFRMD